MAKRKWFQLSPKSEVVYYTLSGLLRTRPIIFIIGVILGIVGMSLYDNYQTELFLAKKQRIIDSLGVEITVKNRQNDELTSKAQSLEERLAKEKGDVTNVINNFPSQQRPEIKNSDTAVKFILDFIRK